MSGACCALLLTAVSVLPAAGQTTAVAFAPTPASTSATWSPVRWGIRGGTFTVRYVATGNIPTRVVGNQQVRAGYTFGGFGEVVSRTERWCLRTDLAVRHHGQGYASDNEDFRLRLTSNEVALAPTVLLRLFRTPIHVLAGMELRTVLRARATGYRTNLATGQQMAVDTAYRAPGNVDAGLTLGATARLLRNFDLTLRWVSGQPFTLYAPPTRPAPSASTGFGFNLVSAGTFRTSSVRYSGFEASIGYRLNARRLVSQ